MTSHRISHGAEIIRNRTGTLPPPPPRQRSAVLAASGVCLALGWAIGLIMGLAQ